MVADRDRDEAQHRDDSGGKPAGKLSVYLGYEQEPLVHARRGRRRERDDRERPRHIATHKRKAQSPTRPHPRAPPNRPARPRHPPRRGNPGPHHPPPRAPWTRHRGHRSAHPQARAAHHDPPPGPKGETRAPATRRTPKRKPAAHRGARGVGTKFVIRPFLPRSSALVGRARRLVKRIATSVPHARLGACVGYTDNLGARSVNLALGLAQGRGPCAQSCACSACTRRSTLRAAAQNGRARATRPRGAAR